MATENDDSQCRLVTALVRRAARDACAGDVRLLETHISYVLLTGLYAYKIKKAIKLGFLDFSTLGARKRFCDEELRLNRRLAPDLYIDVVAVTGSAENPALSGDGTAVEYAVRMREFPQRALATEVLARGELWKGHIDALAAEVAAFHRAVGVASAGSEYGTPVAILSIALRNFSELQPLLDDPGEVRDLCALADWTRDEHARCAAAMALRRDQGFIRECHGDLHLGNIAILDDKPVVFDCIEFNDSMRWIDVMSEIAFAVMDLESRNRVDLARRLLNAYLEITGDYGGASVLRFYLVYRAIVRAKVARLRAQQLTNENASDALVADSRSHFRLAKTLAHRRTPALIITHGLSGSGKTTVSRALLEKIGAVRIRTDVERKRLHGLCAVESGSNAFNRGLYAPEVTRATYARTLACARSIAEAGFIAMIDAAFLKRWQRDQVRDLAAVLGITFIIVTLVADEATLRERIAGRIRGARDASDADLAVLDFQLRTQEPLSPDELQDAIVCDAGMDASLAHSLDGVTNAIEQRLKNVRAH